MPRAGSVRAFLGTNHCAAHRKGGIRFADAAEGVMKYAWVVMAALVAGCVDTAGVPNSVIDASEPQYAPDDSCKGVVPELCPR